MNGNRWKPKDEFPATPTRRRCTRGWSDSFPKATRSHRHQVRRWRSRKLTTRSRPKDCQSWRRSSPSRQTRKSWWKPRRERWRSKESRGSSRESFTSGKRRKESNRSRRPLRFCILNTKPCWRLTKWRKEREKSRRDWSAAYQSTVSSPCQAMWTFKSPINRRVCR